MHFAGFVKFYKVRYSGMVVDAAIRCSSEKAGNQVPVLPLASTSTEKRSREVLLDDDERAAKAMREWNAVQFAVGGAGACTGIASGTFVISHQAPASWHCS